MALEPTSVSEMSNTIETDFLVVGAGPAGAALGSFLGQNGLKGLIISRASSSSHTPRAHIFNPFAAECLRDIGLEDEARRLAHTGPTIDSFRWARSMVGVEYGRTHACGGHPEAKKELLYGSPCVWTDFPQTKLEPLLVNYASHHGFDVRFSTKLVGVERRADVSVCTVQDLIFHNTYQIRARYLFGADGGRSLIARSLDFQFLPSPDLGMACNIFIKADLGHLMHERGASLHYIVNPGSTRDRTQFGVGTIMRMVKPWSQWLINTMVPGGQAHPLRDMTPESPELHEWIKELIGEDVDVEVLTMDAWVLRENVAARYDVEGGEANLFLLGDAAHRHTPAYGLGSNTCVQDAYNLAWKVALVSRGLAGRGLLDTYNEERQPVGANIVREASAAVLAHFSVLEALGMYTKTPDEGARYVEELRAATEAGEARRAELQQALDSVRVEGLTLGLCGNQWYTSRAVYLEDETGPRPDPGDHVTKYLVSTYPGTRLPHVWLDVATRRKAISTHDLAGKGSFTLFAGIGGEAWRRAVENIAKETGIPIRSYGIGFGLDYHDVYQDWRVRREVGETGCVLVRPDRFVAWRSQSIIPDCESKLRVVLSRILDTKL